MKDLSILPVSRPLLTGLGFGESPRWHKGRLWFANWGRREIVSVDPDGKSQVMLRVPTDIPCSIDWLPDGTLLVVSGQEALLLRQSPDGSLVTYADLRPISPYAWNELVVDGRGNSYVNGGGKWGAPASGMIALITPDGSVRKVAKGIAFPNGMVVTPDNATLIIAESYGNKLTAFDIAADGSLLNKRTWADLGDAAPDGICLDAENAIWYADVPNQQCVRVKEGGEILETVLLDRGGFACMLGGEDKTTLFIMAAEWHGFEKMADGLGTGQVLTAPAPAKAAGFPAS